MELRQATPDDLDSMTDVMVSAFPMDPQWDYRFPYRLEYPEDHWRCTRRTLAKFFRKDHFVINIVTDGNGSEPGSRRAVALAVWELAFEMIGGREDPQPGRPGICVPGLETKTR